MKKLLLSLGVIAVFAAYSIMERQQGASVVLLPSKSSPSQPITTSGSATTSQPGTNTTVTNVSAQYKDGTYTGQEANAFYGNIKVAVTISGGKITTVRFLEHPNDNPNSISINQQAMPFLQQETIRAQSANVNIISGATDTSQAFIQSLSSALSQAT